MRPAGRPAFAARLAGAEPEQYERVMEAVQLTVAATRDEVTVERMPPPVPPVHHHCTNMGMSVRLSQTAARNSCRSAGLLH